MLEDVHKRHDYLTSWLRWEIKKALYVHWETDKEFRHRRLTKKANRASARSSKYTGGSATFIKTKVRLRVEAVTHQSQQNSENANDSAASVVDPDAIWRETLSGHTRTMYTGWGRSSPVPSAPLR
ncbi:hypothetical protein Ahy_B05g076292 [Arachis hypogaea]|uniref:Uncharacterized protein n=1 Tax=Arachis hypogaea TaxID=3818 RepID=A0A444Z2Y1_ARAHY|nr:hypothetical protein Ahy_B05g076292 [Arachis hypogaea]